MIYNDNRQMLIGLLEEYMDGKTDEYEFFIKVNDFEEDFADSRTLTVITHELFINSEERPCFAESRKSWDLWQRLLLILKSGADLYDSYTETEKGCAPFKDFKQIRKAYNRSEGFRKRRFEGFNEKIFKVPQEDEENNIANTVLMVLVVIVLLGVCVCLSPFTMLYTLYHIIFGREPASIFYWDGNSNYKVKFSN